MKSAYKQIRYSIKIIIFILLIINFVVSSCSSRATSDTISENEEQKISEIQLNKPVEAQEIATKQIEKKYLLGKIQTSDTIFRKIPREYCLYRDEFLLPEVLQKFIEMYAEAQKDGIELKVISALRPFDQAIYGQKYLWERKWRNDTDPIEMAKEILHLSAMPGTSRHHWGTDIDICLLEDAYFTKNPQGIKTYQWLQENAHKFGFYQPYTAGRQSGYNEEKWHWSYMPLAKIYQKNYKEKIDYSDITGFKGCETAKELDVIKNYVFGINEKLL